MIESNVEEIIEIERAAPVTILTPSPTGGGNEPVYELTELRKDDLIRMFYSDPNMAYIARLRGDSMIGAGIGDGDYVSVDYNKPAKNGDIILANYNGELIVKRLVYERGATYLVSENHSYKRYAVGADDALQVLAVVTGVHRRF